MDTIKDNIPVISILILIIGASNLLIYYSYFGIDIMSYLDFSEVIQLQFKVFALTGCIAFASLLYGLLFEYKDLGPASADSNRQKRRSITAAAEANKGKRTFSLHLIFNIFLIIICTPILWLLVYKNKDWTPLLIISIPVFISIILYAYFKFRKGVVEGYRIKLTESGGIISKEFSTKQEKNLINAGGLLAIFATIIYISSIYTFCEARSILQYSSFKEVVLYLEKDTITTNINYRYIGKTKNFVFFYNKNTKQADIYSAGSIKRITIGTTKTQLIKTSK